MYIKTEKAYIPKVWVSGIASSNPKIVSERPYGMLTPGGTNSAAKKRINTIERWATRRKIEGIITEREPEPDIGYEITGHVHHGYASDSMGIYDPNGYIISIPIENLLYIVKHCSIVAGTIRDEMQWIRHNRDNILVPTDSEVFIKVSQNPRK